MNNIEFGNYNPNGNDEHEMTYNEAEAALAAEPRIYKVIIDGKRETLLTLYNLLGNLPSSVKNIVVHHPDHWEVIFGKSNMNDGTWYLYRSSPLSKYGVFTRTFGTRFIMENAIWDSITDLFPGIEDEIKTEQIAYKKLANLRTKALLETSKQAGLPEDLENYLLPSYFESQSRPTGYGEILNNMRKINTTLFTKGGKRKGKKSKTRKYKKQAK